MTLAKRARNVVNAIWPYIDGHVLPPLAEVYDLAESIKETEDREAKCDHAMEKDSAVSGYPHLYCRDCGKERANE